MTADSIEYALINWEAREVWYCSICKRYRHRISRPGLLPAICCGPPACGTAISDLSPSLCRSRSPHNHWNPCNSGFLRCQLMQTAAQSPAVCSTSMARS
jgi:hypothetical protein